MRVKLLLAMRSHQKSHMITGIVNADFEPIISLSVCGSDGKIYTQDAIVELISTVDISEN